MSLSVGLVGWGEIAQYHLRHLLNCGCQIGGVVSRRDLDLDYPVFHSMESLLPHVNAVTICLPNFLHTAACLEAVESGTAVLVEKPICIEEGDLDRLEPAFEKATAAIQVGFRLRHSPALKALRPQIRGLRAIRCFYRIGIDELAGGSDWTRRFETSGGAWFTLGVHALDLCRWLARCSGEALEINKSRAEVVGPEADYPLLVEAQGKLPSGVRIGVGVDLRPNQPFQLELSLEAESPRELELTDFGVLPEDARAPDLEYAGLIGEFVNAVQAGRPDRADLAEVIQVHRDLFRIRELSRMA